MKAEETVSWHLFEFLQVWQHWNNDFKTTLLNKTAQKQNENELVARAGSDEPISQCGDDSVVIAHTNWCCTTSQKAIKRTSFHNLYLPFLIVTTPHSQTTRGVRKRGAKGPFPIFQTRRTETFLTNAQSRFAIVFLDRVLGFLRQAWCT